jgi:hypothetical protein
MQNRRAGLVVIGAVYRFSVLNSAVTRHLAEIGGFCKLISLRFI